MVLPLGCIASGTLALSFTVLVLGRCWAVSRSLGALTWPGSMLFTTQLLMMCVPGRAADGAAHLSCCAVQASTRFRTPPIPIGLLVPISAEGGAQTAAAAIVSMHPP